MRPASSTIILRAMTTAVDRLRYDRDRVPVATVATVAKVAVNAAASKRSSPERPAEIPA
jgi:hypothetical protein